MFGGYDMSNLAADTSMIVSQSDGSLAYLPSLEAALSSTTTSADDLTSDLAATSIHNPQTDDEDDWDTNQRRRAHLHSPRLPSRAQRLLPSKPRGLTSWTAHAYEAWIAAFDCYTPTTVWSAATTSPLKAGTSVNPSPPPPSPPQHSPAPNRSAAA